MKAREKPHDPGRDQRLKWNRARSTKKIIHIFKRSINRKAHSEAGSLPARQPRNAHPSLSRIRLLSVYPVLPSMSKITGRVES
ncbi:hypothetical protein KKHLCK_04915 [Candidatus Electrothrix laxa]